MKPSRKRALKRAEFKKLGRGLTENAIKHGDPDVNDYYTGKLSKFYPASGDTSPRLPDAPEFRGPQWIRTV